MVNRQEPAAGLHLSLRSCRCVLSTPLAPNIHSISHRQNRVNCMENSAPPAVLQPRFWEIGLCTAMLQCPTLIRAADKFQGNLINRVSHRAGPGEQGRGGRGLTSVCWASESASHGFFFFLFAVSSCRLHCSRSLQINTCFVKAVLSLEAHTMVCSLCAPF